MIVAHRLAKIQNADLILLVKDGDIVKYGTHSELMSRNEHYAQLYKRDFENN